MAKLNQILAVEKGVRSRTNKAFTDLYRELQKTPLLSGISRTYVPRDDEGEVFPPESTRVQVSATHGLELAEGFLVAMFDVVATKEVANTHASAPVIVDGVAVTSSLPVTYLLFLEKQLVELHEFVRGLPTLDPAETWQWDENLGVWATPTILTNKSKKVPRNHVKAPATDKHPAQVEVYTEDVTIGQWHTVKYSGALPTARRDEMLARVEKLAAAVKFAREEANVLEVEQVEIGKDLLAWVFHGTLPPR